MIFVRLAGKGRGEEAAVSTAEGYGHVCITSMSQRGHDRYCVAPLGNEGAGGSAFRARAAMELPARSPYPAPLI